MLLAFLLVAGMADWVPAHWFSHDPKSLNLVKDSGINCLLLGRGDIDPRFLDLARAAGIATVAVVRPGEPLPAGRVDAIALEGEFDTPAGATVPVIELPGRHKIRLDSTAPINGTSQGLWPGIVIEHGGKVNAGPTSSPWVDTNTGFLHFLRAAMKGSLWIGATPPARTVIPVERYAIAIADAEAAGARWIITLDEDLQQRLRAGDPAAIRDWRQICAYVQYFEGHQEWREYRQFSEMALMQDAASGGLLSAGLLDLMSAQHVAARAIEPRQLSEADLRRVRTVIDLAPAELSAEQQQALQKFAKSGGVLLSAPADWRFGADSPGSTGPSKQQVRNIQDIWEMLYNATARRNFGARTFNTSGILFNVLSGPGDRSLLVHLVNYTGYPGDSIRVHALGRWTKARLYAPGAKTRELAVYPVKDGTGVDLEKLDVVASVLFE